MDKNKKWIRTTVELTFKERQGLWERVSRKITGLQRPVFNADWFIGCDFGKFVI